MKNISLLKIIVAMLVCNTYLFTCSVMGTVDGKPTAPVAEENENNVENEAHGVGTQDFLTSDEVEEVPAANVLENLTKLDIETPKLEMKPFSSSYKPTSLVNNMTSGSSVSSSSSDLSSSSSSSSATSSSSSKNSSSSTSSSKQQSSSSSVRSSSSSSKSSSSSSKSSSSEKQSSSSSASSSSASKSSSSSASSEMTESSQSSSDNSGSGTPSDNSAAANEILTVNNQGNIVSGKALDIISRIVTNEIGGTFAPEAIKAQAVAAYTHVKYNNLHGNNPSVALANNVSESVRVLVASVIGQAVYYNGEMIQAVYSASSSGYTASSEFVYLQSVYCELDKDYDPNYGRQKTFSSADIKKRVYDNTGISLTGDPAEWFSIDEYADGNYVALMSVGGQQTYINSSGKTANITGRVFREVIMDFDIRSNAFDIDYDAATDVFTITTYGYGHGVGLSQNGANNLAKYWVWDYKQILEFYYQGTIVK